MLIESRVWCLRRETGSISVSGVRGIARSRLQVSSSLGRARKSRVLRMVSKTSIGMVSKREGQGVIGKTSDIDDYGLVVASRLAISIWPVDPVTSSTNF